MGTYRARSWRRGAISVALWALLATAATLELYDEVPPDPEVESPSYQDENFIDSGGPVENPKGGQELALAKDVLLYRLIQSIQRDSQHAPKFRLDWQTDEHEPHHHNAIRPPLDDDYSPKEVVKRLTHALRSERSLGFRRLDQMYRPQQKWKIKKGKSLGNQMVCYFKLCAFRSPV